MRVGVFATMKVLLGTFMAFRKSGIAFAVLFAASACGSKEDSNDPTPDGGGGGPTVLDGGGKIPDPPDGEAACQPGPCNYQKQDCPSGQACVPTTTPPASGDWPPACQVAGTKTAGQECAGWNDCETGLFCAGVGVWPDGGVKPGTCQKLCCGGDWSACGAGESCYRQLFLLRPGAAPGSDPVYAGADLCGAVGGCDLFDADSCPDPSKSCQLVDPRGSVACLPEGTAGLGEPCSTITRCKSGSVCKGARCRRLCRAVEGGSPMCPPDEGVCVHFATNPEGVGECTQVL